MANNYLLFSTMLKIQSIEEREWLAAEITSLQIKQDETLEPRGFQWEFEPEGLWIYAEEYGCPENVCELVQRFLAKFHPENVFTFSWAFTCSKPALDEFGGGAALVRADGYQTIDAAGEMENLIHEHGEKL